MVSSLGLQSFGCIQFCHRMGLAFDIDKGVAIDVFFEIKILNDACFEWQLPILQIDWFKLNF